ncbi:MAG: hypothetical protein RTU63_02300 [Candidatus Thorarchaeota archaeon]
MAEQFISRLNQIEESINQLGETLKRMITILGSVTEMKSDIRVAKDEILQALANLPAPAPAGAPANDNTDEYAKMVVQEVGAVRVFVQENVESLKNDMMAMFNEMSGKMEAAAAAAPPAPVAPAPAPTPAPAPAPEPVAATPEPVIQVEPASAAPAVVSIPADRAMKVADQLEIILKSLKMGCIAGKVTDTMTEAKAEIMKIVPSDPIMVKMDKWAGIVSAYPKRKELQARDILKLKKDLKAEIPKYRPA